MKLLVPAAMAALVLVAGCGGAGDEEAEAPMTADGSRDAVVNAGSQG